MSLDKLSKNTSKKIAFILIDYPIGVSSMVINSIRLFVKKGYSIDVFTNQKNLLHSPIEFSDPEISLNVYDDTSINILFKVYRFIIRRTGNLLLGLTRIISNKLILLILFPHIFMYFLWLKKRIKSTDYSFLIPVEFYSLVVLGFVKNKKKIIYFNMELMDWAKDSELISNKLIWKTMEYREIAFINHAVLPSKPRADAFSKINDINKNQLIILPVTSMGEPIKKRSPFFRDQFDIPDDKKIVIYSGNIKPWAKCSEIINTVKQWPSEFVLIMHTWNTEIMKSKYVQDMKRISDGLPVYFSNRYIDYNDLALALSSADIGLAFYQDIDKNFSEILFSSNKIAEYLKAGLAVICSDFPELNQFVQFNKIGHAITVDELPEVLENMRDKLETYRANALKCYRDNYRFEVYFDNFFKKII